MLDRPNAIMTIRHLGAFDLKWVLIRRIVSAALLCIAVGVAIVLSDAAAGARRQNLDVSKTISDVLKLQLLRIDSALDLRQRYPDWSSVLNFTLQPGQCVILAVPRDTTHSRCIGTDSRQLKAPSWFAAFYDAVFLGNVDTVEIITHQTNNRGTLEVTANRDALAYQAWVSVSDMLRLSLALIAIMCVLVYVAVERALRPTGDILASLLNLANGDLTVRLPRYRLRELDRISDGINSLAQQLRVTMAERSEFARRLINAQEQERRHIARDLHDDVGQQLTALSGLGASIKSSVEDDEPISKFEVDELVKVTGSALLSLRATLAYLRPLEIDNLGLRASLDGLVSDHNRRSRGSTHYYLTTSGDVDVFDPDTSAHIYRIVQEALNNAARHAGARAVAVSLINSGPVAKQDGSTHQDVRLTIEDDGSGWAEASAASISGKYGLLGMRERVSALGGVLSVGSSPQGGASLRVQFGVLDSRAAT